MKHLAEALKSRIGSDWRHQIALVILAVMALAGIWYAMHRHTQTTDNATVQCELVDVVSEVDGKIEALHFRDDQPVRQGGALITVEPALFKAQFDKAAANLNVARSSLSSAENKARMLDIEIDSEVRRSSNAVDAAQAALVSMNDGIEESAQELNASAIELGHLKRNFERDSELNARKAISGKDFEASRYAYMAKAAAHAAFSARLAKQKKLRDAERANTLNVAHAKDTLLKLRADRVDEARTAVHEARNRVAVAQAEYELARLQLDRTVSKATRTGTITNRRISPGEYIRVGQRVASIVSCQDKPWITANFKENQIAAMKEGQKAEITLDTYPGVVMHGRVESISSGSGATFSVLPPENATGNFTKVVKRMPVKISLAVPASHVLRVGASAEVKVFTQ